MVPVSSARKRGAASPSATAADLSGADNAIRGIVHSKTVAWTGSNRKMRSPSRSAMPRGRPR